MEKQSNFARHASGRTAHFTRLADDKRRQLSDVDVRLIRLQKQIAGVDRADPKIKQTVDLIDWLTKQSKQLRAEVSRALFNAGRV